jgi:hypothetical protein
LGGSGMKRSDKNSKQHNDKLCKSKTTKEDDAMNIALEKEKVIYDNNTFLNEFEESLKELHILKSNKSNLAKSNWRDLFDKGEK